MPVHLGDMLRVIGRIPPDRPTNPEWERVVILDQGTVLRAIMEACAPIEKNEKGDVRR